MVIATFNDGRPVDVQAGQLQVRLAESAQEIRQAQALRYKIFYEEMSAQPTLKMRHTKRDVDSFDEFCDHLLVLDRSGGGQKIVGTYRMLRRDGALARGQFYSSDEYDISRLIAYPGEILEVGRSCVDADFRTGSTMQLLWRGIAEYVLHYEVTFLFGCASLPSTKPQDLAVPLSYLYHHHLAPPALRPVAVTDRYVDMNLLPADDIDPRRALAYLPPLVKGYLRVGGFVGDGAVVDQQFGTTDVCIVVKTDLITDRYFRHYIRDGQADSTPSAVEG